MKRFCAVFLVFLSSCAGGPDILGYEKYELRNRANPPAKVEFLKGNLRLSMMRGDAQYYGIKKGPACGESELLITYSGGIGGNTEQKVKEIESGVKTQLIASTHKQAPGGYQTEIFSYCTNLVEFTPIAGKKYNIIQIPDGQNLVRSCELKVVDAESGVEPADLQILPAPVCKAF
jgi:hypothetical protein